MVTVYNLAVIVTEWAAVVNAGSIMKLGYPKYISLIYSNTFPKGMHVYITILLGLNQPTAFASNLLQCRGGSTNPTTFKMELFATIANG